MNLRTEVVSLADLLAPAAANLACPLTRRSLYYHDPCYHARYNGVVKQPRRALSQLAELRELGTVRAQLSVAASRRQACIAGSAAIAST